MTILEMKVNNKEQLAAALIQNHFKDKAVMIMDICDILVKNSEGYVFSLEFEHIKNKTHTEILLRITTQRLTKMEFKHKTPL